MVHPGQTLPASLWTAATAAWACLMLMVSTLISDFFLGTHVSESSSPWEGTGREHQDPSPAACSDMPSNLALQWKGEKSRVVMLPVDITQSLVKV